MDLYIRVGLVGFGETYFASLSNFNLVVLLLGWWSVVLVLKLRFSDEHRIHFGFKCGLAAELQVERQI